MTHRIGCRWRRLAGRRPAGVPSTLFPGRSAVLLALLLALPWAIQSCSRGDNSLLNPGTNRQGLQAPPETLAVGDPTADRSTRVQVGTGGLDTLTLAKTDSVESILFLRFGALPEVDDITEARLELRVHARQGSSLRIDACAVDSLSDWTESAIRWSNQPALSEPFSTSGPIPPPPADSAAQYPAQPGAVVMVGETVRWVQVWKRNPSLGGLALKISSASPDGELRILSRETAVYDADGIVLLNPRLRLYEGSSSDEENDRAPTEDALIYRDGRPALEGSEPTLLVSQWLPTRALLRFDLRPLLTRIPRGVTVNRARLYLAVASVAPGDTFQLGVSQSLGSWTEGAEPDTTGSGGTTDVVSIPEDIDPSTSTIALDIGPVVQQQLLSGPEGLALAADSLDVMVRVIGEGRAPRRIRFHSGEAEAPLGPSLELIYTPPPETRWNGPSSERVR